MEPTMTDDQRLKILNDAAGFNAQNGIELTIGMMVLVLCALIGRMHHVNPMLLVHGGLYTSMLDVALAMTGSYRPAPDSIDPWADIIADNTISCLKPL